jgi:hypothetical protein
MLIAQKLRKKYKLTTPSSLLKRPEQTTIIYDTWLRNLSSEIFGPETASYPIMQVYHNLQLVMYGVNLTPIPKTAIRQKSVMKRRHKQYEKPREKKKKMNK